MMLCRSALFIPGNNYRAILKSEKIDFDIAIFDLEDAVPVNDKETARIFVRDAIERLKFNGRKKFVRINSDYDDDLNEIALRGLDGVMLPKSESERDIRNLERKLSRLEDERNLNEIRIIPLIESARGVMNSFEIASSSDRIVALAFGAVDYYRTLGRSYFKFSNTQIELLFARSMIVNAAKAAGLKAIDSPFFGMLIDMEGLLKESKLAFQLGFDGKLAIHPNHIKIINEVFSPSKEEFEEARKIVESYEAAKQRGEGVITFEGRMVDFASYKQARDVVETYLEIERRGEELK
ncbi:Citrate lyase beta subunit [Archaeoglobus sulfaticallidus PM70-1]|uniref:Citrate lyase beta subunit n=1 Tax=Archaeoglobus sulfaticallidus PM70-1 TaxID=387631 RepID=N0BK65_9EURY|nr:CoA ester lyase [Archaeoglobus sulfaticallidus]AGK60896.1 Citrate lyase beta subunit [Archaeoglobus sulfaticallidus PM70-1]